MGSPRGRRKWKVAAIQLTSTADVEQNVARATRWVRRAAAAGARLVALPENFAYLRGEGRPVVFKESLEGGLVGSFADLAGNLGIHLLLGSFPEAIPRSRRVYNTSVLLGPDGRKLAVYRKMHLFDIHIRGKAVLRESKTVAPGGPPVVADTSLGKLGMSICYDLRFPELYRDLVRRGAVALLVPSAFTAYTGPYHWVPLLRARAIENLCWVVAPAQVGQHNISRRSHGETVIINPWGKVVARKAKGEGWVAAEIDLGLVDRVRRGLPCLDHVRPELFGGSRKK